MPILHHQLRTGRPRRHGPKLETKDPTTWPAPSEEHHCEDPAYGTVEVRAWANLHPKVQFHENRGTRGPTPIVRGTLVLVEVSRLPRPTRQPPMLWLWWHGVGEPDLELLWRAYVRRFDLEHTFRFFKQTLGWTTPRVRHPEQADRCSWLILATYTQLCAWRVHALRTVAASLGKKLRPCSSEAVPSPPKRFGTFARTGHARQAAETLWTLTGTSQRSPLGPGKALPDHQQDGLRQRRS